MLLFDSSSIGRRRVAPYCVNLWVGERLYGPVVPETKRACVEQERAILLELTPDIGMKGLLSVE